MSFGVDVSPAFRRPGRGDRSRPGPILLTGAWVFSTKPRASWANPWASLTKPGASAGWMVWWGLLASVVAGGCGRDTAPGRGERAAVSGEVAEASRERAMAARDALFGQLSGKLMEAMGSGGPPAAINICKQVAPQLAAQVSADHELKIGRTSFRLRNEENQPPGWAEPMIRDRVNEPTFVRIDEGHDGALLPIRLQPQCVVCHGERSRLAPGVAEQLARLYPADQATGFREGDLRGWFWVEVPREASADDDAG